MAKKPNPNRDYEVPEYSYLMLSGKQLSGIYWSLDKAEDLYTKIRDKFDGEAGEYRGWERYCCRPKLPENAEVMRGIAENFMGSPVIEGRT